jgi:hypothetical protein
MALMERTEAAVAEGRARAADLSLAPVNPDRVKMAETPMGFTPVAAEALPV